MRKERSALKLASLKLQDATIEQERVYIELKNKLAALNTASESLSRQRILADSMVIDYTTLFKGEQQKFEAGESSLFLVNSRESKLIEAKLKAIDTEVEQKMALAEFYFNSTFQSLKE